MSAFIEVDTPLQKAMWDELRKKLVPLERCGIPLHTLRITLHLRNRDVTSDVTIEGGGYTPVEQQGVMQTERVR